MTVSRSSNAQVKSDDGTKIWELRTYLGGVWVTTWHINDLGVLVGRGDIPPTGSDGVDYTHTLAVPLFGPHAGEWIDLGTLGGEEPTGWEEPYTDISNSGLVVSHSIAQGGQLRAVAWTKESGMVDLGTLKDSGDPEYSSHNASVAFATNKLGTLIGGGSGAEENPIAEPVVWTPSIAWMNGKLVTTWKIHKLDTSEFPDLTRWYIWGINDYGQIIGTGANSDETTATGMLWGPRSDGKGWKFVSVLQSTAYPQTWPYSINDKGEVIGGANSMDWSVGVSLLWKPLNDKRTKYSDPIELPMPNGGFTLCEGVGINDLGDLVGDCQSPTEDLPVRWTTKDLTFSKIIDFPGDWGFAWGVNNSRIATVTYGGGENCPPDTYISCGGAIQLPLKGKRD